MQPPGAATGQGQHGHASQQAEHPARRAAVAVLTLRTVDAQLLQQSGIDDSPPEMEPDALCSAVRTRQA